MTPEQIEGNKIIAEFMGGEFFTDTHSLEVSILDLRVRNIEPNKKTSRYISALEYHSSWSWLMPVVEKIESLPTDKESGSQFQFNITGDGVSITQFDDGSGVIEQRVNEIGKSKLKSSFEVVVEFIKWHNQNIQQ